MVKTESDSARLVSVRLKSEQANFLEEKRRQGISASFVIRKALDAWMAMECGQENNDDNWRKDYEQQ